MMKTIKFYVEKTSGMMIILIGVLLLNYNSSFAQQPVISQLEISYTYLNESGDTDTSGATIGIDSLASWNVVLSLNTTDLSSIAAIQVKVGSQFGDDDLFSQNIALENAILTQYNGNILILKFGAVSFPINSYYRVSILNGNGQAINTILKQL